MKYQEDSLHIFGENTTPASIHNITMLESIEMPSHKIEAIDILPKCGTIQD